MKANRKPKRKRGSIMWAIPFIAYGRQKETHPLLIGSAWMLLPTRRPNKWVIDQDDSKRAVKVRVILEKP